MRKKRYGCWADDPDGYPENVANCVKEVYNKCVGIRASQCSRKRGYGPGEKYCKQHAKMVEGKPTDATKQYRITE